MLMHHHPVALGAPRDMGPGVDPGRPLLLQRSDDRFIESTLEDLRSDAGRSTLAGLQARARDAQGRLQLFQPIQRQFHLVLVQAFCELPGMPRLDPAKVASAGLVLRRLRSDGTREGWMRSQGQVRGWVPLARVGGETADPLAEQRVAAQPTGVASIDRHLRAHTLARPDALLDEDVVPLYVAPPEVNAQAGQTLYYGVLPTASSEFSPEPASLADDGGAGTAADFSPGSTLFRNHLVEALRGDAMDLPFPGEPLRAGWFDALEAVGVDPPEGVSQDQADELRDPDNENHRRMVRFILLLRQLAAEFNAFDEDDAGGAGIRQQLAQRSLPLKRREGETEHREVNAYTFLSQAATVLLDKGTVGGEVEMPERWPGLDADAAQQLGASLGQALGARLAATQAREGRFADGALRYQVRAFVRLKPEGGCPARLVWTPRYSEAFVIAPWYQSAGDAPPVQVALPDPFDRGAMKALKPNVAFVVPPAMHNLLTGSAKSLLEGKGGKGTLGITWICSFSIPIITICAFLSLNILLSLFNIFFGWMAFFKICIPFPKFGDKPPGG